MSCFQNKDTEYFYGVSRIACLENEMITKEELMKAAGAGSFEKALKYICTKPTLKDGNIDNYEKVLDIHLAKTYEMIEEMTGNVGITNVFRYPVDCHNLKVMLKSEAACGDFFGCCKKGGTVDIYNFDTGKRALAQSVLEKFPPILTEAYKKGSRLMEETGEVQRADILMDKAVLDLISLTAEDLGIELIKKYAEAMVDMANMGAALRLLKIKANTFAAEELFSCGGSVGLSELRKAYGAGYRGIREIADIISHSSGMVKAVDMIMQGGSVTFFEAEKERYLGEIFGSWLAEPFGIEHIIRFIYMKRREAAGCRLVLTAISFDVDENEIKKRLRWLYGE